MVSARLTPEAKAALVRQHLDDGVPLTRLAAAAGLPARTLRRWAASYRTDPTTAVLQRQARSDLGRRRLPEDLIAVGRVAVVREGLQPRVDRGHYGADGGVAGGGQVRDYYDRHHLGVILIGMPGIERRLARYPQLYSRIGFAHEYRTLNPDEFTVVLTRRWPADGLAAAQRNAPTDDFTQTVAITTIARITGGNFRLLDRLLTQIQRIRHINDLDTITPEVVEAAREALLIGT